MSEIAITGHVPQYRKLNYLNNGHTVASWLLTKDHKRIAVLYLFSIVFMFFVGGLAAGLVRLELTSPHGQLFTSEQYNKLFSAHGIVMVFFVIIPGIPAVLGNFALPLMIGAKDLAFPRLNLLSWYLYVAGAIIVLTSFVMGGVDAGWTFYTPLSSIYSNTQITLCLLGIFLAGFSSIFTGLNFVATVHKMRAPGMTWFRLPHFVWAQYATSLIMLLGTPVVAITLVLVILERSLRFGIFSPELGGDPVLFQHLFWFYSHPAVYIMILPAMGVISELVSCFSRRRLFGYEFVAFSSIAIAAIGFLIWGHHMFVSSQSTLQNIVFSLLTLIVAVPSAVKTFNWTLTMYKGSVAFTTPMLYVFGFIGLFLVGGLTGPYLGAVAADVHLTGTYFVVAHFHYIMVGGAIMGLMGGLHFWWPKMFGRMYSEFWGKLTALIIFVGFNFTFFPQFILGYLGMPRRYHYYYFEPTWQLYNVMSSAGATVLGIGYLLPVFYLSHSLIKGKEAGPNPWGAKGLEWEHADSPPDTHNFTHKIVVTEPPYNYDAIEDTNEFRKRWGARPVVYTEDND